MSALEATVNTVKFRAGNSSSTVDECLPGRVEYQPVTFEAGITNDATFQEWANALVHNEFSASNRTTGGTRLPDPQFRREVEIRVKDIDGTEVKQYKLFRAWVSKYTAMSDLAGDGNDVLIETLEVTHEGFELIASSSSS
jgi:phage tail-like protein